MSNYQQSRAWADSYNAHINAIAEHLYSKNHLMNIHFRESTPEEDRNGVDMFLTVERAPLSYRVRKASDEKYYRCGFTLRTSGRPGYSELDKILSEKGAHYFLYCLAHSDDFGKVQSAMLIDLRKLALWLQVNPHLLEEAKRGTGFIEFRYTDIYFAIVDNYEDGLETYDDIEDEGEIVCQ